jgi:prepilin peptidase CpaA
MSGVIPIAFVGFVMAVASFTDVYRFKVYNALTFPVFFSGLVYHLASSQGQGALFSLGGAGVGLAVLLLPYLMGGLGAGDVKFVMAIGAWVGVPVLLPSVLIGCFVVFVYHMIVVAKQRGIGEVVHGVQLMLFRLSCFGRNLAMNDQFESVQSAARSTESPNRGRLIPFSAMMSVGFVVVLLLNWWISRVYQ